MAQVSEQQENKQHEKVFSEEDQRSIDPCRDYRDDCRKCDHGLNNRIDHLRFDITRDFASFPFARISLVGTDCQFQSIDLVVCIFHIRYCRVNKVFTLVFCGSDVGEYFTSPRPLTSDL